MGKASDISHFLNTFVQNRVLSDKCPSQNVMLQYKYIIISSQFLQVVFMVWFWVSVLLELVVFTMIAHPVTYHES